MWEEACKPKRTATMSCSKYLLWLMLLVFLTYPQSTYEMGPHFGDGDAKHQVAKRRPYEPKFKFHKIERIYDPDDNDDDTTNEEQGDIGSTGDDDDDGADVVNDDISDRTAADSSQANEAEETQFVRARKAEKVSKSAIKPPKAFIASQTVESGNKRVVDSTEESYFTTIFGRLFGAEKQKPTKTKVKPNAVEKTEPRQEGSNGIIDWLKWMAEKVAPPQPLQPPPLTTSPTSADETWLSYLNRWPFNTFFPIGQPAKPIRMPRRTINNPATGNVSAEMPSSMSQEHFESLLHTLPGFVANGTRVADVECRQQLQIFQRQLRGHKLWTLQMLDATGKITSGLLRGNINQFGDFDQCMQVKTLVKVTPEISLRIRGKYCLAHIETQTTVPALKVPLHLAQGRGLWNSHLGNPGHFVPRYSVANWGICIPHSCSAEVVRDMLQTNLRPYNTTGVEFHVEVDDDDCYIRQSKKFSKLLQKDGKFGMTVFYICLLAFFGLTSLFYDQWFTMWIFLNSQLKSFRHTISNIKANESTAEESDVVERNPEVETKTYETANNEEVLMAEAKEPLPLKVLFQEIFKSFSPQRTLNVLIAPDQLADEFPVFHVLRLGATFALYVCLKYLLIGHLPISNRDKLVHTVDQPSSILFRTPMIYMDVLLLISGFLGAYQLSIEMESKSYIQLLKCLAGKISRYLPTLYMVLCFQTWILPHLGAGPLWTNLIGQNARLCEQQMWRNMFSVQNVIDFEETCSPMSIQLALEVQLFLLGPLIVWLYYTDADAAFFVYGGIHALSVAARYSRTQREHLSMTLFHGMNVSKFYRTANLLYSSPVSRATPYLLGIGAGMLHRAHAGNLDITPELMPVGWSFAVLGILWCFWSPSASMRTDFIYSANDAASYAAWCPLILGLALLWIIFVFPKGEKSVLRFLTTLRPILFLSRIAFPMQLVTYVVVLYNTASVKEQRKFQWTDLVNFNELGVILAFAIVLAFLIDIPSQHIRRLLVQRIFIERTYQEQEDEPSSGADHSEAEASEERSERTTCDTPEPQESIWTSDPSSASEDIIAKAESDTYEDKAEVPQNTESVNEVETSDTKSEEEADEDEIDISEEDEIKKRPITPPTRTYETDETETKINNYTRRRRRLSDD